MSGIAAFICVLHAGIVSTIRGGEGGGGAKRERGTFPLVDWTSHWEMPLQEQHNNNIGFLQVKDWYYLFAPQYIYIV